MSKYSVRKYSGISDVFQVMIHSKYALVLIDPLGRRTSRPVGIIVFAHVRPSVRPHFSKQI